jgi:phosphoribosylformimino-5-aminoimidazole carboxamide ribotide isomerase
LFEKFTVIPAIDLKGGKVVRLLRGDMNRATVYGGDPGATARRFEEEGAQLIHIVDLDGAIAGAPQNVEAIAQIRASVKCAIDVSGGLRTIEAVRATFARGADRISIGSAALLDPDLLRSACDEFPDRVFG